MSRKLVAAVMVAVWVGWPAAVSACDFTFAYHFLGMSDSGTAIGAGVAISPLNGDGDAFVNTTAGVGFKLGDNVALAPLVGWCKGTGDEDDISEIMFGGGGVFNLFSSDDGGTMFNVQTHAAYTSYEGDFSTLAIPVMAVVGHAVSDGVLLYGEGGFVWERESFDGDSDSETDPVVAGGLAFGAGDFNIVTGLTLIFGESQNDFGLVAAISRPLG